MSSELMLFRPAALPTKGILRDAVTYFKQKGKGRCFDEEGSVCVLRDEDDRHTCVFGAWVTKPEATYLRELNALDGDVSGTLDRLDLNPRFETTERRKHRSLFSRLQGIHDSRTVWAYSVAAYGDIFTGWQRLAEVCWDENVDPYDVGITTDMVREEA